MEYEDIIPKKPENIALSFSGGGFRAASFSLGCLSYLDMINFRKKKLTGLIQFISSASGGTITNLAYTASQRELLTFDKFYKLMIEHVLSGSNIIKRVFEILNSKSCWDEHPLKSKNIINAFSIAYDEILFKGKTFGTYFTFVPRTVPEVCANTTEFDNGMLFRFQNAGVAGNKFLYFKDDPASRSILDNIKLGDILACSSCFPVGFEPFMFPADFTHSQLSQPTLEKAMEENTQFSPAKNDLPKKAIFFGLMDGGIDDNQGIDSFIKAEERLENKNKFGYDLYIACDVSSDYTSGYDFPEENKNNFFLKFSMLQYVFLVAFLFVISLAGIFLKILIPLSFSILGVSTFFLLLTVLFIITGWRGYRSSVKNNNTYGMIIFPHIWLFLKLKLSTLLQLLSSRATSAGYLASVVFLKKIRRISYDRIFEKISERKYKADGEEFKKGEDESLVTKIKLKHWSKFTLQNAVYLLSRKNHAQRIADIHKEKWANKNITVTVDGKQVSLLNFMHPSPAQQQVANIATEMDTTLWYDNIQVKNKSPESLIATGQFTTCYNLLRYAYRFDRTDPDWAAFQESLLEDWERFRKNPYWMYDLYKKIPV